MLAAAVVTASTLRAIARHPRLPREELVRFQNIRLRRLVTHAYEWLHVRMRAALGAGVEFEPLPVSDLELESNGKFRVFRSRVDSPNERAAEVEPRREAIAVS